MSTPSKTEIPLPVDIHPRPTPYHVGSDTTHHTEVAQWDGKLPGVCIGSEAEATGTGGSHGVPRVCPLIGYLDCGLVRSHGKRIVNSNSKSKNQTIATVTHLNKFLNPRIVKNRKWAVFRIVNHSHTIWDPKANPRGLLGGHLNIQCLIAKSDQMQHLLLDSTLDFLCLSETWLNKNAPSAAVNVSGFKVFRRDREISKGGGVICLLGGQVQRAEETCMQKRFPESYCNCKDFYFSPDKSGAAG